MTTGASIDTSRAPETPPTDGQPHSAGRGLRPTPSWPVMLLGSLALAGLSVVVLPRTIAYDPWSWLIWGREIIHLSLNTRGAATSVKPLPIFLNTLYAVFGSRAEPVLWLLTARTATVLAIVLAFRLGARLAGLGAGLVAAVGLAASNDFLGYLFVAGMSEPMATAAVLAAVDSHLDGRRRAVYWWLVVAGLLRPEAWPFLILYAVAAAYPGLPTHTVGARWRHPALTWPRAAGILLALAVPPSWFVIDWFGARQLFRSAGAATKESQGGPLLSREPGLATVHETWHLMSAPMIVLFVAGFVVAVVQSARLRRLTPAAWLSTGALAWLVVDAVLAQGRFATGAPRYLLPGSALACVVAGIVAVDASKALRRWLPAPRLARAGVVMGCLALVACSVPRLVTTGRQVRSGVQQGRVSDQLRTSLQAAVKADGGRDAVVECGPVITRNFQVPLVAWTLNVPLDAVNYVPTGEGTVLQQLLNPRIPFPLRSNYRYVGAAGPPAARWTVLTTC